jgi:hypothetical protein
MPPEHGPRARDFGWLAAAVVFAVLTVYYLWRIAAELAGLPLRDVMLVGIVGVVIALGGIWLTVGAWRRTIWGGGGPDSQD